ncbi:Gag-Pol polyprotein, partial [Mucuna pruriens]
MGIDFMGPFPVSYGNSYILLVVDYVSRWVKARATEAKDAKTIVEFVKSNIFYKFGVLKALNSDQGSHFCNCAMATLLEKYGVVHQVATAYHPQTNGLAEVFNREIKKLLQKMENLNRNDWNRLLEDALWAILRKEFKVSQKLIVGKLRSRWDGPYIVTNIFPYGIVEVRDEANNNTFKVNGHQLKPYHEGLNLSSTLGKVIHHIGGTGFALTLNILFDLHAMMRSKEKTESKSKTMRKSSWSNNDSNLEPDPS